MKRNSFADQNIASVVRTFVGEGEIWLPNSSADYDAIFIQSRNDQGDKESYLIYYMQEVSKRLALAEKHVRGQRFLGIAGNSAYEPPQQRVDDAEMLRLQVLSGLYDYVATGRTEILTKESLIAGFHNQGPFDRNRVRLN